jgi:hypothetical protein
VTRREIQKHLRFGSHCAAWSYTDKIISVDPIKGYRVTIDLRLNALFVHLPYSLLNAACFLGVRALLLP